MILLSISDRVVDLYPGQTIATTFQKINIGDISARYLNYTSRLKAPFTENNNIIFGLSKNEESLTSKPYTKLNCKVSIYGLEIRTITICIIDSVEDDGYVISLIEDGFDYFKSIKGKLLLDINPIATSSWNASGIDASRTNTEGIIAAVLHWGKSGGIYQYDYFLPCFYYHSIIKSLLEFTGLELSGDILTDSRFTDLVMPYWAESFEYDSRFNYLNTLATNQTEDSFGIIDPMGDFSGIIVSLPTVPYGDSNIENSVYTVSSDGAGVNLTVEVRIDFEVFDWSDATFVRAIIAVNDDDSGTGFTIFNPSAGSGEQTFTLTDDFQDGDTIHISFDTDASMADVGITINPGVFLRVTVNTTVNRDAVNWNALLGELSCDDLIADFFNRFALIHKIENGVMYLKSIEEIISDRENAIDWSSKLVRLEKIYFHGENGNSDFSQNNYFTYEDSEDVKDPELGKGNMAISNEILDSDNEIFESFFQKTNLTVIGDYRVATIPVFDASSASIEDFVSDQPGVRLLTLKDRTIENSITFDSVARTDYKLAYFVDQQQDKDTGFQYFIDQFYPSLSTALQKSKFITKYYNLSIVDINMYDPHKLIFDGDGYYIVNKISNFVQGRLTKVELFKVS